MSTKKTLNLIRIYLALALFSGLLTAFRLARLSSGPEQTWFTEISFKSLALIFPVLLICITLIWLLANTWRQPRWAVRLVQKLNALVRNDRIYWLTMIVAGCVLFINILLIQTASWVTNLQLQPFIKYLTPYLIWFTILVLLTIFVVRFLRYGMGLQAYNTYKRTFKASAIALVILAGLSIFVLLTGIGLTPDPAMWGDPGTPILQTHVLISLMLTLVVYLGTYLLSWIVERLLHRQLVIPGWVVTLSLFLAIWLLTIWLWSAEPLGRNYFTPDPVPPNFEIYPHSDAATYEIGAQNLLIGKSPNEDLVRPLYSFFMATAQRISGIGYQNILTWQIPLFALLPAVLFLLVKRIHHTLSGLLVALLVIFQQTNALALSGVINVSHVKLLMSDFPATLALAAFSLAAVFWLSNKEIRVSRGVLTAGILALAMLVRVQSGFVALAIIGIIFLLGIKSQRKEWFVQAVIFAASLILIVSPWMLRNWRMTGQFGFSELGSSSHAQIEVLGMRYSQTPDKEGAARIEGESQDEFLNRMVGGAVAFALENPGETAQFVIAHLLHNEVSTIFVLPVEYNLPENLQDFASRLPYWSDRPLKLWKHCCSLDSYVEGLPYWDFWDGTIQVVSYIPLLSTLILIAVGIGASWGRLGWVGLIPLLVNLSYSLGNALARNSGWRFNMPVDWVGTLYFGMGIMQVCFWIGTFFSNRFIPTSLLPNLITKRLKTRYFSLDWKRAILTGLVFVLLVAAVPLVEWAVPDRYAGESAQSILNKLDQEGQLASSGLEISTVEEFMQSEGSISAIGRALYPRFFLEDEGLPGTGWPGFAPMEISRFTFVFTGVNPNRVVLPFDDAPGYFPHASDVLVVGCQRDDYVEAYLVAIYTNKEQVIFRSPSSEWACGHSSTSTQP